MKDSKQQHDETKSNGKPIDSKTNNNKNKIVYVPRQKINLFTNIEDSEYLVLLRDILKAPYPNKINLFNELTSRIHEEIYMLQTPSHTAGYYIGVTKYNDPFNWHNGDIIDYLNALARHLLAVLNDEVYDEDYYKHIDAVSSNLRFIAYFIERDAVQEYNKGGN